MTYVEKLHHVVLTNEIILQRYARQIFHIVHFVVQRTCAFKVKSKQAIIELEPQIIYLCLVDKYTNGNYGVWTPHDDRYVVSILWTLLVCIKSYNRCLPRCSRQRRHCSQETRGRANSYMMLQIGQQELSFGKNRSRHQIWEQIILIFIILERDQIAYRPWLKRAPNARDPKDDPAMQHIPHDL